MISARSASGILRTSVRSSNLCKLVASPSRERVKTSNNRKSATESSLLHVRSHCWYALIGQYHRSQVKVHAAADSPESAELGDGAAGIAQKITGLFPLVGIHEIELLLQSLSLIFLAFITFPFSKLWVVLAASAALIYPPIFTWIQTGWITYGLAATMLGMGLTMKMSDFTTVFQKMPALLFLGLILQYTVMPMLGYLFSRFSGLGVSLATGVALLSSCPGGTASNIVAFIAKGEMGLSIMMTTVSTLAAVGATPLMTQLLAGALVPVNAKALFASTLQVVLAPVLMGAFANQRFPGTVAKISKFTPAVATLLIAIIVGTTLAHSAHAVRTTGLQLLAVVACLHGSGFMVGYWVSRLLGLSERICRTNSIEVGMQNATLGAVLAALHFSDPLVAAPCAISSCTQSVMGSLLAAFWRDRPLE